MGLITPEDLTSGYPTWLPNSSGQLIIHKTLLGEPHTLTFILDSLHHRLVKTQISSSAIKGDGMINEMETEAQMGLEGDMWSNGESSETDKWVNGEERRLWGCSVRNESYIQ